MSSQGILFGSATKMILLAVIRLISWALGHIRSVIDARFSLQHSCLIFLEWEAHDLCRMIDNLNDHIHDVILEVISLFLLRFRLKEVASRIIMRYWSRTDHGHFARRFGLIPG